MKKYNSPSLRNILIFSLVSALAGWIGLGLNQLFGLTDPTENLGMLLFLLLPPMTGLLLRAFAGDGWSDLGWKPNLGGNFLGYGIALFAFPLIAGAVLLTGALGGATSLDGFISKGLLNFLGVFGIMFAADFFKNIFEEFSWRGYLTPRLKAVGLPDLVNHLLTGVVWASWHIPYWLFMLDRTTLHKFTTVSLSVFALLSIANIVTSAILYGEVRLLTGSTWAAVLLHTMANAFTLALLLEGFVMVNPASEIWFSPGGIGLIGMVLTTLAGLGLRLYRLKTAK